MLSRRCKRSTLAMCPSFLPSSLSCPHVHPLNSLPLSVLKALAPLILWSTHLAKLQPSAFSRPAERSRRKLPSQPGRVNPNQRNHRPQGGAGCSLCVSGELAFCPIAIRPASFQASPTQPSRSAEGHVPQFIVQTEAIIWEPLRCPVPEHKPPQLPIHYKSPSLWVPSYFSRIEIISVLFSFLPSFLPSPFPLLLLLLLLLLILLPLLLPSSCTISSHISCCNPF